MNAQQYHMMRVVQKIRVFHGFSVDEVLRLLRICRAVTYRAGDAVLRAGDPSDEMLILLKGLLRVSSPAGDVLAELPPGASTGEMGLFTGHARSATITAAAESACLLVRKADLAAYLSHNKDTHLRLLYNVIGLLSDRLAEANQTNSGLSLQLARLEDVPDEDAADGVGDDGAAPDPVGDGGGGDAPACPE